MEDRDLEKLTIERKQKDNQPQQKQKPTLPIILGAAGIIIVILIVWAFTSKGVTVSVATVSEVYPSQLLARLSASGYVVAQRKADVATKVTGQLVDLMVQEGSVVKQGQLLARLENEDAKAVVDQSRANLTLAGARVQEAQANLNNISRDFERMKNLVKSGAVSRSEYDTARTRYLSAQAALEAAQAAVKSSRAALSSSEVSLSYTEIRAPFDAVVLTKNADVGDIITPLGSAANAKAAVVTIADLSSLQVEADVAESNIGIVSVGQPCDITLDALPGIRFQGTVDTIVPTVDRTKATVLVKVTFAKPDTRILPEMSAKVGFLSRPLTSKEKKPRTMVNSSAIVSSGEQGPALFIVREDKAAKTNIRTGEKFGDMVEILQGAKPGDVVVLNPPENLRNGSKIAIAEN